MPYINEPARQRLDNADESPTTVGDLNYCLTMECLRYIRERGPLSYERINEVVGALECAKQEFYRRVAVPYEDLKIRINGDVY